MGTRGLIGFRFDGKDKLTYNHYDSYPSGVGVDILEEIRKTNLGILKSIFGGIELVDEDIKPTREQIEEYKYFSDERVSSKSLDEWYVLLRSTQGTLQPYIEGKLKHMIESSPFIYDSLFCEWCYIVNLDTEKFEVWTGFQERGKKDNRYGDKPNEGGYYPCRLVKEYDLKNLPTKEQFIKDLEPEED